MNHRSVILKLVVVLVTDDRALVVSSASKCTTNVNGGIGADCILTVVLAQILETRFVNDARANHLSIANLKGVFSRNIVVSLGRQIELSYAVIVLRVAKILVARGQSIVFVDRVIESRAQVGAVPRIGNRFLQVERIEILIQDERIHRGHIIDVSPLPIEKEGRRFPQRAADTPIVDSRVVAGLCAGEGIM